MKRLLLIAAALLVGCAAFRHYPACSKGYPFCAAARRGEVYCGFGATGAAFDCCRCGRK